MDQEKIIDKIVKLRNLSGSSNEHEAALALDKMQKMIDKYSITPELLQQLNNNDINLVELRWIKPLHRTLKGWEIELGSSIAKLFDAKTLSMCSGRHRNTIIFVGIETDAKVAMDTFNWIYEILHNKAEQERQMALWDIKDEFGKNWKRESTFSGVAFKQSFFVGATQGLQEKINKIMNARREKYKNDTNSEFNSIALTIIDTKAEKIKKETSKYDSLTTTNMDVKNVNGYVSGLITGKKINLTNEIKE